MHQTNFQGISFLSSPRSRCFDSLPSLSAAIFFLLSMKARVNETSSSRIPGRAIDSQELQRRRRLARRTERE